MVHAWAVVTTGDFAPQKEGRRAARYYVDVLPVRAAARRSARQFRWLYPLGTFTVVKLVEEPRPEHPMRAVNQVAKQIVVYPGSLKRVVGITEP